MIPQPRLSDEPPYRWVHSVVLTGEAIQACLDALPRESHLVTQLRDTALVAESLADRLNGIDKCGRGA